MKRIALTLALLALPGCTEPAAPAADPSPSAAEPSSPLPQIAVAAASALFTSGRGAPVDANSPATRESEGVVPGAVLLSSSGSYDLAELPPASAGTLVFYCANEYCTASHRAAERARAAGREVAVMGGGIAGWKQAGQATVPPSS